MDGICVLHMYVCVYVVYYVRLGPHYCTSKISQAYVVNAVLLALKTERGLPFFTAVKMYWLSHAYVA